MKQQQCIFYNWASGRIDGAIRQSGTNLLGGGPPVWERILFRQDESS
jgi:hypothetical protein